MGQISGNDKAHFIKKKKSFFLLLTFLLQPMVHKGHAQSSDAISSSLPSNYLRLSAAN